MTVENNNPQRVYYLDGLRGVACILVIFFHMPHYFKEAFNNLGYFGWFGENLFLIINGHFSVCIFFVLSGYALIFAFNQTGENKYLARGAVKRYFRLMPVILAALIFQYLLVRFNFNYNHKAAEIYVTDNEVLKHFYVESKNFKDYLLNGLYGVYKGELIYNYALWTIKIEFFASLFLFGFCSLFFNTSKNYNIFSLLSILIITFLFGNDGCYASLFIVGSMILKSNPQSPKMAFLLIPALLLGSNPIFGINIINEIDSFIHIKKIFPSVDPYVFFNSLGAALLFLSLINNNKLKIIFSLKPICFLGNISFSMYLLHTPIMMSLGAFTYYLLALHLGHNFAAFGAILSTTLGTILFSYLCTKFIDNPTQKLASKFAKKII